MPPQEQEGKSKDSYREEVLPPKEPLLAPEQLTEAKPFPPEKPSLSPLRTYKSDTAEAVRERRESVSSIVTAERTRREISGRIGAQAPEESFILGFRTKTSAFLALSAAVVFSLGAGLVSFLLLWREQEPEITPAAQALVFVNKEIKIDAGTLEKTAIEAEIKKALGTRDAVLNDLVAITFVRERADTKSGKPVEEIVGIQEILSRLTKNTPPQFLRALGDEYLYGVHVLGENIPFLIVRVDSYESAFAGVFGWAKTITRDLAAFFNITRFPPPEIYEFSDILIKNRDVGVLYDEARVPIIYYSFVDRETLILTTDRITFEELLNRLATPKRTLR